MDNEQRLKELEAKHAKLVSTLKSVLLFVVAVAVVIFIFHYFEQRKEDAKANEAQIRQDARWLAGYK